MKRLAAASWQRWTSPLHARLQPLRAQLQGRWKALTRRERGQVLAMLCVVTVAAVWLLGIKPALDTLRYWDGELPRLRSQAAALKDVLADVGGPAVVAGDAARDPAGRVRASLDAAGLAGAYRLSEAGAELQIEIERAADASRVAAWLLAAPGALGMTVNKAMLQRSEDAGPDGRNDVRATVALTARPQSGNR